MGTADDEEIKIRIYDRRIDRTRVEDLERKCEVGPGDNIFLFTNTMGDPLCRIRNSLLYVMLVAELHAELVGVIQGSIKITTLGSSPPTDKAIMGYILGLRVLPPHRRKGVGMALVRKLEGWFVANGVDFAYMATEKDNKASLKLFTQKLGFLKFRTPSILVNPVRYHAMRLSPNVKFVKLNIQQAESLYRRSMGKAEFFPNDIDRILKNRLSLGTWVAYPREDKSCCKFDIDSDCCFPTSWAMLSVWNSGDIFKLRVGKAPMSCIMFSKTSRLIDCVFPCLNLQTLPNVFDPFGFYFMYGLHHEGPRAGKLVRSLCRMVHNMAIESSDCKVVVTEVEDSKTLRLNIPHSEQLSCSEDLWCIKALKMSEENKNRLNGLIRTPHPSTLFVDPREV
ncbi:hypothetical protein Sjap_001482 [Stephania japonica]|uniref:N-acetyltransferase domain-containing protein n=1 Tax=Stephania japonica TaxID=461633 RepID=A0AAP0KK17_9MAGN